MTLEIRNLDALEVNTIIDWARLEGWNPGHRDAATFYQISPHSFWGAFLNGELVASISLINYDQQFGFLGLYICRPEFRGRGIGFKLWNAVSDHHAQLPSIGLDGVVEQQDNYKKFGFQYAFANCRFGGLKPQFSPKLDSGLRPIDASDLTSIAAFEKDNAIFPANRASLNEIWLLRHSSLGLWSNDSLLGYGSIRKCADGYKVGPLVANSLDDATAILQGLIASISEGMIYVDVPMPNLMAVEFFKSLKFEPTFETARMYKGKIPNLDLQKIYGVTTLELG